MPSNSPASPKDFFASRNVLLFLYSALMLYAAWTPPLDIPLLLSDKWIHAIEFFILFWIVRRSFAGAAWAVGAYGAGMALLTEGIQFFTVQRSPEFWDLAADASGFTAAALLSKILFKKRNPA